MNALITNKSVKVLNSDRVVLIDLVLATRDVVVRITLRVLHAVLPSWSKTEKLGRGIQHGGGRLRVLFLHIVLKNPVNEQ